MRIAIVINASWNIYNFRIGLIRAFIEAGHEVHAIAPSDDYSEKLIKEGCYYHPVRLDTKGSHPIHDLLFIKQLYSIYTKVRPDITLHYTIKPNIYGTIAASVLSIPVVNNVSGLGTVFIHNNSTSKIAHLLYRVAFRLPKKVFFQNPDDQQLFVRKKLVNPQITDVLPGSGVDLEKFVPQPFKRNATFTFLLIARLLYDKGIVEYIEAIKIIKAMGLRANFLLLGFTDKSPLGIPEAQLQEWTSSDLVTYLGTTDDVKAVINEADCVVLPSYREGTPRTLLEAASLAKPLLATRVPGCVEVVEDGVNGFLCEARNPEDLARQMQKMISLDNLGLQQMGEASRQIAVAKFDEKLVIKKYFEALL